jgi:23S rRNA pseudouridine1911/1915/1917 synthase
VLINGVPVTAKRRLVLTNDDVTYTVAPEKPTGLEPEDIPLDIRYEDDDILVLSKPSGMVVHPSHNHMSGTLVNALIARYGYDNLAVVQGADRPGIVHRLDMETSGLMLAAKTDAAATALQQAIRLKEVDRRYIALVHGYIAPNTGLIDAPLMHGGPNRMQMVVRDGQDAKQSITSFEVLQRYSAGAHDDGYTLVECKLYTGRMHQIRAHMAYIGHACVGDPLYKYGDKHKRQGDVASASFGLDRQFLHSYKLTFTHPITGEQMHFQDELPPELADALELIEERKI